MTWAPQSNIKTPSVLKCRDKSVTALPQLSEAFHAHEPTNMKGNKMAVIVLVCLIKKK